MPDTKKVLVEYELKGEHGQKLIDFSEFEEAFDNSLKNAVNGPNSNENEAVGGKSG